MFKPYLFWPGFAGLIVLIAGLIVARRERDKVAVLGRVFFAFGLADFGALHLCIPQFIMQTVPAWMPGRLLWAYFVGIALIASAVSIALNKYVRLSAPLQALMFFGFVAMIHIPNVARDPRNRILWAVALRDLSFAGGALALAGWVIPARLCIGIPAIFFAVEHFLHPEFAPGVPLEKMTPPWIPIRVVWGYLVGAALLVAGAAMLINQQTRRAATGLGMTITLVVLCIYIPILIVANGPADQLEAMNYVADTLLYAGTILLLAAAAPTQSRA